MSRFMSSRLSTLKPYTPGEQPRGREYIKLNTNESPFPPSENVIKAVNSAAVSELRLYSDPECTELREAIARYTGYQSKNIFVGNGSDEVLSFLFMAYGDNGVTYPSVSYGFYKVYCDLYGLEKHEKALREDFTICPDDYIGGKSLKVIANPNAPTGMALGTYEIERIVQGNPDSVVVIDEAYVDFGAESAVGLVKKYPNLAVVQTFSKSRSLAGARLGFCVASEALTDDLNRIKYSNNPYNINRLTLIAGKAAIEDREYFEKCRREIIRVRELFSQQLIERGFAVLKSSANFVFAKSPEIGGKELYLRLKEKGFLIRHFDSDGISDYNRITIGLEDDMRSLISAIDSL